MQYQRLSIPDVVLLKPKVFSDERGFFFESYNAASFEAFLGRSVVFMQDNHSLSHQGVIRGLHYQRAPKAQGKIVRVTKGEVFDVAVDIRKNSPTFGQWVGEILSAENKHQMWIPEGFAHGFLTLSAEAELLYKATELYAPQFERCIAWNDQDIGIAWPLVGGLSAILSDKDKIGMSLKGAELF